MYASPSERRRYPRFELRIPMRYRKVETYARGYKGSLIKDISAGGVRMSSYEFLPRDLKLAAEIPLVSETGPMKATCRVVWAIKAAFSEQYDIGVEFSNPELFRDTKWKLPQI